MAEPTKKNPELDSFMEQAFGFNRKNVIQSNKCVPPPIGCGKDATEFRDELSRKEYTISGLCQNCQDEIFGGNDK